MHTKKKKNKKKTGKYNNNHTDFFEIGFKKPTAYIKCKI